MKRLILILLCMGLYTTGFGENLPSIAVLKLQTDTVALRDINSTVAYLENALVNTGIYNVVERSNIEAALNELQMQSTDLFNADQASELGRFIGARFVVIGNMQWMGHKFELNVKIVDVESIVILKSTIVEAYTIDELRGAAERAIAMLTDAQTVESIVEPYKETSEKHKEPRTHPLRPLAWLFWTSSVGCLATGIGFTGKFSSLRDEARNLYDDYETMVSSATTAELDTAYSLAIDKRGNAVTRRNLGLLFYGLSTFCIGMGTVFFVKKRDDAGSQKAVSIGIFSDINGFSTQIGIRF